MTRLDGKVAVVTGAGRGLGRAHTVALARAGASVLVNDVDGDAAEAVAAEVGGVADDTNLCSVAAGAAVVEHTVERFGRIDIVVNNAGISRLTPILELDDAVLELHLGVHLKATVGATRAAFAAMAGTGGGRVINTVSREGLDPRHPNSAAYAAAKAGIYAFTKVAAVEGAGIGVTVNAISPVAVTRMSERYFADADPELRARLRPEAVADVVVFLASDQAATITGRIIRVEGDSTSEAYMALRSWAYARDT